MSAIGELTQQIDPWRPLTTAEGKDGELYVDWQETLGGDNVKVRLSRDIARCPGQPAVHLLTGLQGTGKTTELYRVKNMLEAGVDDVKFFVSMLEAEKSLELSDVKAELLSYQVISQLVTDLQDSGFRFEKKGSVLKFFGDLSDDFKKLRIDAIQLGNGMVNFTLRVQDITGDRRQDYQQLLQGKLPKIHDMANQHLLIEARAWLAKQDIDDILIVVDELDRMQSSADRLFIEGANWLRALGCQMLYTVPLYLYYSHQQRQLQNIFGTDSMILPVMPVNDRDGKEDPLALQALRDIVSRRGRAAGLDIMDIFEDEERLRQILMVSGGHVRTLLRMLRSMLNRCPDLPITSKVVGQSLERDGNDMRSTLSDEEWQVVTKVHRTKKAVNGPESDRWNKLISGQYVFAYYEDGSGYWYDWNPVLQYAGVRKPAR